MRRVKKFLAVFICAIMTLPAMAFSAASDKGTTAGGMAYTLHEHGVEITDYTGKETKIIIPDVIEGRPVTTIGEGAFSYSPDVTGITIPASVTYIAAAAFQDCTGLTEITIPGGVVEIGDSAFQGCMNLGKADILSGVKKIGRYAFKACASLTSVSLPSSITHIGEGAFDNTAVYNNSSNWDGGVLYIGNHLIKAENVSGSYVIRDGTLAIAGEAFSGCEGLTNVEFPMGIASAGDRAFSGCINLTGVKTVSDAALYIGDSAFRDCGSLASVDILSESADIGDEAFAGCKSLTELRIRSSKAELGNGAFQDCIELENVGIWSKDVRVRAKAFENTALQNDVAGWDNGVLYIGQCLIKANKNISGSYEIKPGTVSIADSAFESCRSLTGIKIPSGVTYIGDKAFSLCKSLTDVDIPSGVNYIGKEAFSLTAVYGDDSKRDNGALYIGNYLIDVSSDIYGIYKIEAGTLNIAGEAFSGCVGLTGLYIPAGITGIGVSAFSGCTSLTDVYFGGSEKEWNDIVKESGNEQLLKAEMHYSERSAGVSVIVNGSEIIFDVPPIVTDGTTMLPVRMALEPLGARFRWNSSSSTVTIDTAGKVVVLTVGSTTALVDGVNKPLAKPAVIVDGRTLIPIRFVAEELGFKVDWDDATRTVIING